MTFSPDGPPLAVAQADPALIAADEAWRARQAVIERFLERIHAAFAEGDCPLYPLTVDEFKEHVPHGPRVRSSRAEPIRAARLHDGVAAIFKMRASSEQHDHRLFVPEEGPGCTSARLLMPTSAPIVLPISWPRASQS